MVKRLTVLRKYIVAHKLFAAIVIPTFIANLCLGVLVLRSSTGAAYDNTAYVQGAAKTLAASTAKAKTGNSLAVSNASSKPDSTAPPAKNKPACPPQVSSPACSTTISPKPETQRPIKNLSFNQTNFVLRAGEKSAGAITVRASTGEPIAMPGNPYYNRGPVFISYSGGGSTTEKRSQWIMDITVDGNTHPGTYQSEIGAGSNDADFTGTIHITVPSEPTFYISASMQQNGVYNYVAIDIMRDAGFNDTLTVAFQSLTPNIPLRCTFIEAQNNGDKLLYSCYPDQPATWPAPGTILRTGITVSSPKQSRYATVSWAN